MGCQGLAYWTPLSSMLARASSQRSGRRRLVQLLVVRRLVVRSRAAATSAAPRGRGRSARAPRPPAQPAGRLVAERQRARAARASSSPRAWAASAAARAPAGGADDPDRAARRGSSRSVPPRAPPAVACRRGPERDVAQLDRARRRARGGSLLLVGELALLEQVRLGPRASAAWRRTGRRPAASPHWAAQASSRSPTTRPGRRSRRSASASCRWVTTTPEPLPSQLAQAAARAPCRRAALLSGTDPDCLLVEPCELQPLRRGLQLLRCRPDVRLYITQRQLSACRRSVTGTGRTLGNRATPVRDVHTRHCGPSRSRSTKKTVTIT